MNDAAGDISDPTPRTSRGQRIWAWMSDHPRLRFGILSVVALGLIAGTWTGISYASEPQTPAQNAIQDTETSESPSSEPSATKSPEEKETEKKDKPEKPGKPKPKTEPEPEDTQDKEPKSQPTPAGCGSYSGNQLTACGMLSDHGFDSGQMECLNSLWEHESGWNHEASNPSSGAYGIPQALPGNKMASAGGDWNSNPATQIKWGLGYIGDRYGDPCGAWSFWQANNYY